MFYTDPYADKYQELNGFKGYVNTVNGQREAYISMKPTTRAANDLSMREHTIDGLITTDYIDEIKSGYTFYLEADPKHLYFIQTMSKWETQYRSLNFNGVKCNCKVTIKRKVYNEETMQEELVDIYTDVDSYIFETLQDSKNFDAGFEVNTLKVVQMPMREIKQDEDGKNIETIREVYENDTAIVTSNLSDELICKIEVESVDNFGISGSLKFQGTQEMR